MPWQLATAWAAIALLAAYTLYTALTLLAPRTPTHDTASPPANERCRAVVERAAAQDVVLEPHVRLICPGPALTPDGKEHSGITCFPHGAKGPEGDCEYVSINVGRAETDDELYAVFVHEAHHSIYDSSDECAADNYAASKGARPEFLFYDC